MSLCALDGALVFHLADEAGQPSCKCRKHRQFSPVPDEATSGLRPCASCFPDHDEVRRTVYFVKVHDAFLPHWANKVKIGCTSDLPRRLMELRHHYQCEVVVLATTPGGLDLERALHTAFADGRYAATELFTPSPRLLAYIEALEPVTGSENCRRGVAARKAVA